MNRELPKYELHETNNKNWFYLFECSHITNGTFPMETAIPIGDHVNFLLCKHCWNHIIGMVTTQLLNELLKQRLFEIHPKVWPGLHKDEPDHDKMNV